MRNLKFRNLHLLSENEQAARSISFDPKSTVILGENDTGKSSLIKSIYATFGADPAVLHTEWKKLGVTSVVEFDIDGEVYSLLRHAKLFALFDASGAKVWSASGVSKGLAPLLADLLGIKLRLQSRDGGLITPPPAFFFAPFYVDQDAGWTRNWASFGGLAQFERAKENLAPFHAGLRPNEYYLAQAAKIEADRAKAELSKERDALARAAKRLQAGRRVLSFDLKPEDFGERLNLLTGKASELRAAQDEIRKILAELHTERAVLLEQVSISTASLAELDADFQYLRKSADVEIPCPTCGTIHENNFANKFSLIADVDTSRKFLIEAKADLAQVDKKIAEQRKRFASFEGEITEIEGILNTSQNDVRLRDVLESESARMVDEAFLAERKELDSSIGAADRLSAAAAVAMKGFTSRAREKEIKTFFSETLQNFVQQLRVPALPDKFFKSLHANPPETGSDQPRALLAYYFAFAHTVRNFSTSIIAPLVIDSPVQQDQDPQNAKRIIDFVLKNAPDGMQLILGSVRLHEAEYDGDALELTEVRRLLTAQEYESVQKKLAPMMDSLL